MASFDQVLNMGAGQGMNMGAPTARPGTMTGAPPPILGQAVAGMQPTGPEFAPGMPNPLELIAQEMDGPELAHLFGGPEDPMPPLSILELMRLLRMRESWNDGPEAYGSIL